MPSIIRIIHAALTCRLSRPARKDADTRLEVNCQMRGEMSGMTKEHIMTIKIDFHGVVAG